jgi:hypothetical protein
VSTSDGVTLPFQLIILSGILYFYETGTHLAYFGVAANTDYNVTIVYDGTGAANADRLKIYNNGAAVVVTYSGTIGSVLATNNSPLNVFSNNSSPTARTGASISELAFFSTALTAEEVKDLFEQDTIQELDKPLIDLPLRSSYYKATGTQLLVNGDFSSGTTGWTPLRSTLSVVVDPTYGNALRITNDGTGQAFAYETRLTVGKRYKVTGRGRAVATGRPQVAYSATIWNGEISTSWQSFSVEFMADVTQFGLTNSAVNADTEWNDLRVELMENLTENKGTLGGTAKLGDGSTTTTMPTILSPHGASFDGGDHVDLGSPVITSVAKPWTFAAYVNLKQIPSGLAQELLSNYKTTNISKILVQHNVANVLTVYVFKDNSNYKTTTFTFPNVDFNGTVIVTSDGSLTQGGLTLYLNSISQTPAASITGTLTDVSLDLNLIIGKDQDASNYLRSGGKIKRPKIFGYAVTARQAKILHNRLLKEISL